MIVHPVPLQPQSSSEIARGMIAQAEAYVEELNQHSRAVLGVLLGEGFVIMTSDIFCIRFTIENGHCSNPKVQGGSAYTAQRFTEEDARRLAASVTNGKGEKAEAVHITEALTRQIASQLQLIDMLRPAV